MTTQPQTPRRRTWQQAAVRDALEHVEGFVSAQQLHADLRDQGSAIGLATVYRALSSLVESSEADTILSPTGETLFFACEVKGHHHHLICRNCGRTEEINAQIVEDWSQRVAREHGFTEPSHEIDIFGLCQDCQ
ncbi:transcriptional repressor [Leucobacter sp. UCMA 4100]|uniref:Fur family transcriptional regulator n=1 Tax=Leucobacter sp. UCMA 4100 TaxID=2810534 RepID=UPI0022EA5439|nr:transcriptional repressor [Leucobacter sp. UCMA 4100]MDA3146812.1 transcriptional repressor [Leucobacter sp. UCMA 4100]